MLTQNQIVRIHHFGLTSVFDGKNKKYVDILFAAISKRGLLILKHVKNIVTHLKDYISK